MRSFYLPTLFFLFFSVSASAAITDTVSIESTAMHKVKKCVVILPAAARSSSKTLLPAVYLLHGYSGDYSNWIKKVPQLARYADTYNMVIVCPDGDYSSWYFDSPVDATMKYETYIGQEVPAYIEAHYPVIRDRKARAITGLSMGGHGGLFLGFRHAAFFGACGSMSGGVDIATNKKRFDVSKRLGDTIKQAANWKDYSVLNVIELYPKDSLAIIFDCGTDDFFYEDNKRLHVKMLKLKIPHDYIERPGGHTWQYWGNAVQYQLLFFKNYFDRASR